MTSRLDNALEEIKSAPTVITPTVLKEKKPDQPFNLSEFIEANPYKSALGTLGLGGLTYAALGGGEGVSDKIQALMDNPLATTAGLGAAGVLSKITYDALNKEASDGSGMFVVGSPKKDTVYRTDIVGNVMPYDISTEHGTNALVDHMNKERKYNAAAGAVGLGAIGGLIGAAAGKDAISGVTGALAGAGIGALLGYGGSVLEQNITKDMYGITGPNDPKPARLKTSSAEDDNMFKTAEEAYLSGRQLAMAKLAQESLQSLPVPEDQYESLPPEVMSHEVMTQQPYSVTDSAAGSRGGALRSLTSPKIDSDILSGLRTNPMFKDPELSNTTIDTLLGAAAGGGLGALSRFGARGALAGTALGALAGLGLNKALSTSADEIPSLNPLTATSGIMGSDGAVENASEKDLEKAKAFINQVKGMDTPDTSGLSYYFSRMNPFSAASGIMGPGGAVEAKSKKEDNPLAKADNFMDEYGKYMLGAAGAGGLGYGGYRLYDYLDNKKKNERVKQSSFGEDYYNTEYRAGELGLPQIAGAGLLYGAGMGTAAGLASGGISAGIGAAFNPKARLAQAVQNFKHFGTATALPVAAIAGLGLGGAYALKKYTQGNKDQDMTEARRQEIIDRANRNVDRLGRSSLDSLQDKAIYGILGTSFDKESSSHESKYTAEYNHNSLLEGKQKTELPDFLQKEIIDSRAKSANFGKDLMDAYAERERASYLSNMVGGALGGAGLGLGVAGVAHLLKSPGLAKSLARAGALGGSVGGTLGSYAINDHIDKAIAGGVDRDFYEAAYNKQYEDNLFGARSRLEDDLKDVREHKKQWAT